MARFNHPATSVEAQNAEREEQRAARRTRVLKWVLGEQVIITREELEDQGYTVVKKEST